MSVPIIEKLTKAQRTEIFLSVCCFSDVMVEATKTFRLGRGNEEYQFENIKFNMRNENGERKEITMSVIRSDNKYVELLASARDTLESNRKNNGKLSAEERKLIDSLCESMMGYSGLAIHEGYEINGLEQLLKIEIMAMINEEVIVRRCNLCGVYYIVFDNRRFFCDRIFDETEKRCFEIGSKSSWELKIKNDPALEMYTRARKTHHARINKVCDYTKEKYDNWLSVARSKLEKVREGKLDIDEYEKWLKI